jgi:hypothetical protein
MPNKWLFAFAVLFFTAIISGLHGCATFPTVQQVNVPNQFSQQVGQLVVNSNFPLPADHRLLQELKLLREDVAKTLQVPMSNEPIQVYLFADADRYGDFLRQKFPSFPERRAFFLESDTQLAVYAHWGDRVAEDLRHEVSHGYMHAAMPELPLWLDEGLAENFEVARGQNGLNRAHIEELQHAFAQGRWKPNLQDLEKLAEGTEMSQRHYAESWLWVHWMLHTTPQHAEILHTYLRELQLQGERPRTISQRVNELRENVIDDLLKHLHSFPIGS